MTDTKKAAPNGTAQSNHTNDYTTLAETALAEAEAVQRLPESYCPGGSHRALAVCLCWHVARYSPPYPYAKTLPEIQTLVQDASGYSLQVIQAAIDFLTRAGVIEQRFNGAAVVLTIRAGV